MPAPFKHLMHCNALTLSCIVTLLSATVSSPLHASERVMTPSLEEGIQKLSSAQSKTHTGDGLELESSIVRDAVAQLTFRAGPRYPFFFDRVRIGTVFDWCEDASLVSLTASGAIIHISYVGPEGDDLGRFSIDSTTCERDPLLALILSYLRAYPTHDIDESTSLETLALPGKPVHYTYYIVTEEPFTLDPFRSEHLSEICNTETTRDLLDQGVVYEFLHNRNDNGVHIGRVLVDKDACIAFANAR